MAGRKKTYVIELSDDERTNLNQIVAARSSPQAEVYRARIVLACAAHVDWSDERVAAHIGGSAAAVRKWRKRWNSSRSLKEAPRSGRPRVFRPEVRAQLTALACSLPLETATPLARWSCAELAAMLVALGVVAAIAATTVWRWMQQDQLKPWRFRLWQRSRDPFFLQRAKPVLELYAQARVLLQQGVWVVCADEKTSIQAREGVDAPQPSLRKRIAQVAARYWRRGALNLFAALSVADGKVAGCCRRRKRFVDFQVFVHSVLVPEALRRGVREIRLVLDNGPTHAPKQLEAWLAQEVVANEWPFSIQVVWLPTYASWLDQIEIWFSVLQRKLLTPNHFPDLSSLAQRIGEFIAHHNTSAQPIKWTYTVDKLVEQFATD
jgi:transposase